MDQHARLIPLLESDLDAHLITLKFLGLFGDRCRVVLESDAGGWASLVWFDANLFAWDRQTYPQARSIVFVDGTSPSLLTSLARRLPEGPLVVKSTDPRGQTMVERDLGAVCLRRFLWYTGPGSPEGDPSGVREVRGPEAGFDGLLGENGYEPAETAEFWHRGARGYLAEEEGEPRAFCLVYPNHGKVWEVASVKTLEGHRRRGFGARVVQAAVESVVARGHRVRYHVDAENLASRALAESVGLHNHWEARHYPLGF